MDNYPSFSNPSSCDSTSAAVANKDKSKKKRGGAAAKLSTDPQSVAARQRRHRISDRFKILQSLVPGGSKMDTVSMLEQAIQYVKFLKAQIWLHQAMINLVDVDESAAAAAAAPPPAAAISSFQQLNDCGFLPIRDQDQFDLREDCYAVDRLLAECGNLPELWFSGGENWGSDASMQS